MNKYTENAKCHLEINGNCLVYCNKDEICSSNVRGVLKLVVMAAEGESMEEFYCADKVVGKAAAFMYAILKPRELYAEVLSEKAKEILEKYGIRYCYGKTVPAIINRNGDGFCPMEEAIDKAVSPEEALSILSEKLNLKGNANKSEWAKVPILKEC